MSNIQTLRDVMALMRKGDAPGHPFRGNQYTSGEGGGGKEPEKGKVPEKDKKPFDAMGMIISYEQGDLDEEGTRELFQHLVDTGMVNQLQGHYGRTAQAMLQAGFIQPPGRGKR